MIILSEKLKEYTDLDLAVKEIGELIRTEDIFVDEGGIGGGASAKEVHDESKNQG